MTNKQSEVASVRMRWQNLEGTPTQRVLALRVEGWDRDEIAVVRSEMEKRAK